MADGGEFGANGGLASLFELHRAELLRFLVARSGNAAEAEDLLHDLWMKLGSVAAGPIANGRAYLFRMANNLVLDRARGRANAMRRDRAWLDRDEAPVRTIEDRPDPSPDAEEALLADEQARIVREAVEKLPDGARRALVAFRFEGLGQADIAARMGISRSGVEKHLAVAMKHLRRHLQDCGYFAAVTSESQDEPGDAGQIMESET